MLTFTIGKTESINLAAPKEGRSRPILVKYDVVVGVLMDDPLPIYMEVLYACAYCLGMVYILRYSQM